MVVFYNSLATAQEEWILIHKHYPRQKEQTQQRRRTVSFAKPETTHVHEYPYKITSPIEKEACFYQRRDRLFFEQDRFETAMEYQATLAANQTWKESNTQTIRGLEDLFAVQTKEDNRQQHVYAILRAAARIRHEEAALAPAALADTLRYISSELSAAARQRALKMGQEDANQVGR